MFATMHDESGGLTTFTPPPLVPAISPSVHLGLTGVFITLYGFLFVFVYVQLWLVLYYKHKRFSYQTVFLGLCLLWAGLRTSLFSFYFNDTIVANNLTTVFYWLLYCFPVCLQFTTLCLLVLFFAQVRVIRCGFPCFVHQGTEDFLCYLNVFSFAGCLQSKRKL